MRAPSVHIKASKLATVFHFSNFLLRHSWKCHSKLTGRVFRESGRTEENPQKMQLEFTLLSSPRWEYQHFCSRGRRVCAIGWCSWTQVACAYCYRPCVIETWYTAISQKDSPSCLLRCPATSESRATMLHTHTCTGLTSSPVFFLFLKFYSILSAHIAIAANKITWYLNG